MKNVDVRSIGCAGLTLALTTGATHAAFRMVPTQYRTIQAAINASASGDTVYVLDGVYSGAGNHTIDFLGKNITLMSAGGAAHCVIDVAATANLQRGAFSLHSGETSAAVIDGFTVRGGWLFNGPALLLNGSSPTVRNCVFKDNHADCWGGVVYFDGDASPDFSNCRFTHNYSADDGGVVFGFNGSPTFTNCLFADNIAPGSAGAILTYGFDSTPRLVNCTVANNSASFASAIYSNNLAIENCIIWGNTGDAAQMYAPTTQPLNVTYSDIQGGYAGAGNMSVAPNFKDASNGDYHLMPGSSCIDAGDPATVVPQGTLDADGDPRSFGVRIDLGVDEFRKFGDVTGDHMVNTSDLLAVIGAWGPCSWSMADVNGDFSVNVSDLLAVIANWG